MGVGMKSLNSMTFSDTQEVTKLTLGSLTLPRIVGRQSKQVL